MALHSNRLTQDQNFSFHFDGVKTNGSIAQKNRGGLGGRKALNDISNSGKPSALQPSRKHNTMNVIPIGEDLGVSKKSQIRVTGRKPLSDLTNSVKPSAQQQQQQQQQGVKKKTQGKQSITAVAEDEIFPYSIAEEGFLHNHEKCIQSQKNTMGLNQFLKTIGLDEDVCFQSVSACKPLPRQSKEKNPIMIFEMDEIPVPILEDRPSLGQNSPICGSPTSPRLPYEGYDNFPSFILAESPRSSK